MRRTLEMTVIEGIKTSIPLHLKILADADFVAGRLSTSFMERYMAEKKAATAASPKPSEPAGPWPAGRSSIRSSTRDLSRVRPSIRCDVSPRLPARRARAAAAPRQDRSPAPRSSRCRAVVAAARGRGARVIVNDRADIAAMAGAAGVHVGQDDLAGRCDARAARAGRDRRAVRRTTQAQVDAALDVERRLRRGRADLRHRDQGHRLRGARTRSGRATPPAAGSRWWRSAASRSNVRRQVVAAGAVGSRGDLRSPARRSGAAGAPVRRSRTCHAAFACKV